MDHRHIDHRFTGVREILVILAQPPVLVKPAERPLDDPPFWQDDEALDRIGAFDNVQADLALAAQQRHPGLQEAGIGTISPNTAQTGEPMPQEAQQALGAVAVLYARGGYHHRDEQPKRIHEDVPLATFDQFGPVKACVASAVGGFDGLRVDNRRTGLAVTAFEHAEVAT